MKADVCSIDTHMVTISQTKLRNTSQGIQIFMLLKAAARVEELLDTGGCQSLHRFSYFIGCGVEGVGDVSRKNIGSRLLMMILCIGDPEFSKSSHTHLAKNSS